jgi:hypothetical protein
MFCRLYKYGTVRYGTLPFLSVSCLGRVSYRYLMLIRTVYFSNTFLGSVEYR